MHGLYVGVPCILGAGGVEKILEVEMTEDERKLFDAGEPGFFLYRWSRLSRRFR